MNESEGERGEAGASQAAAEVLRLHEAGQLDAAQLRELLSHDDKAVRAAAAFSLGQSGDHESARELIDVWQIQPLEALGPADLHLMRQILLAVEHIDAGLIPLLIPAFPWDSPSLVSELEHMLTRSVDGATRKAALGKLRELPATVDSPVSALRARLAAFPG